jgi:endogenous inhibitor of DNA gyrase (YacG/DUF329 family)
MAAVSTCPTCKGPRKPAAENPSFPFCSKRCKLADLSNWFNERYTVADESSTPVSEEDADGDPRRLLH